MPFDARITPFCHFSGLSDVPTAHQEFRIAARSHDPFGEDELAIVTIQPPPKGSPKGSPRDLGVRDLPSLTHPLSKVVASILV